MDNGVAEDPIDGAISGTFEYVNENNLALSLAIPKSYEGLDFPVITLVAPMSAMNLNRIPLMINGKSASLADMSIFQKDEPRFAFKEFRFLRRLSDNSIRGYLLGSKLTAAGSVSLNGNPCSTAQALSDGLLIVTCESDSSADWEFLAANDPDAAKAKLATLKVVNPLGITISSYKVVDEETEYNNDNVPDFIKVKILGTGFSQEVRLDERQLNGLVTLAYVSPTEMLCEINNPREKESIVLFKNGERAAFTARRPPNRQPPPADGKLKIVKSQSERRVITKE
jgi:hypothetical protein